METYLKKKSIYNIREDHLILMHLIEEAEGEITPEIEGLLIINNSEFESKAISMAYIIKKYQAESETIKNEIDRLSKLKKTADNAADRFKTMLKDAMIQFKFDKIESDTIKIGFRKSKKLDVSDDILEGIKTQITTSTTLRDPVEGETQIPVDILDYIKVKVELDGAGIKAAIDKEGVEIEGVAVKEEKNIQIR